MSTVGFNHEQTICSSTISDFIFDGFEPSNTTPVPDVLFDVLLTRLNEAQLKVMLYIIRRTLGFKKTADAISLMQFRYGITCKDGKKLDEGCGLKNFTSITKALRFLEDMCCIESVKTQTASKDAATTVYRVHFKGTTANVVPPTPNVVGVLRQTYDRTTPNVVGVLRQTEPQETVIQETVIQETVIQETERERIAPTDTQPPTFDVPIVTSALPLSVSLDDENSHDEADRAVIAHMLSQQGNPDSVFYMPPAPLDAPTAPQADNTPVPQENAVTVTTEPLSHNPIAATNATNAPKAKQDAAQPSLLTVTLTEPTMNAEWSAETCVQYVEWKNKKRYDDLKRMKQLDSARTAKRVDPTLTLARFQLAYDDWFVWWKDKKKGSLHVSDMNVKQENTFTRLENALNRIDDESERRDKRKTFSVIAGNKPAQVQQPPKKEQSQEDMDAAKAAYERMMARKQQASAK